MRTGCRRRSYAGCRRDGTRFTRLLRESIVLQAMVQPPDVPGYMRRDAEGEWRDVPVEEATSP